MKAALLFFVIGAYICEVPCHPDGARHVDAESMVGVIGGSFIPIEQAPYMASLRGYEHKRLKHRCGASIIHEQFLLTAASCIRKNLTYKVVVGTDDFNGGTLMEVKKIEIHEEYNNVTFENDLCLIELKKPVKFSSKVAKINLLATLGKLPEGTRFNVTGWGSTGFDPYSRRLLQVEIPLADTKKCQDQYAQVGHLITPQMICAGNRGHGTCRNDGGDPLTLGDVQVGVASFGIKCCGLIPDVFSRIPFALVESMEIQLKKHFNQ